MALRLAVVVEQGRFVITATNTSPAAAGKPDLPCEPVERVGNDLACSIHGSVGAKVMNIHLAPVGLDPTQFDFITLSVGGYPVDKGARYGVQGEPESEQ